MWKYRLRCENCHSEYDAFPLSIDIGPLNDEVVIGKEKSDFEIEVLKTEKLYNHGILKINCPTCLLRAQIARDLFPFSMKEWLSCHKEILQELKIENLFKSSGELMEFPIECPRCSEKIETSEMKKICKYCGSKQLSVIKSANCTQQPHALDSQG